MIGILRRLRAPWRWLARPLQLIPERWRDAAYDWIAANRYRLMGKKATCMIPSPSVRGRFLIDP